MVVVTDDVDRYADGQIRGLAPGVEVHHRDELDRIQRALREVQGCTVIIMWSRPVRPSCVEGASVVWRPKLAKRVVINELVCEGCGDCSAQSNCLSVEAVETEFGRKRRINQSSCNQDFLA